MMSYKNTIIQYTCMISSYFEQAKAAKKRSRYSPLLHFLSIFCFISDTGGSAAQYTRIPDPAPDPDQQFSLRLPAQKSN